MPEPRSALIHLWILDTGEAACENAAMTPVHGLHRVRTALLTGGVVLLAFLFAVPVLTGRRYSALGHSWTFDYDSALCEGWIILAVTAAMCCWQWKSRVRAAAFRPGHWLWLAGWMAFLLCYIVTARAQEPLAALAMVPPLLLCGVCWVAGAKTALGFVWPLLMLCAFAPVWRDYVNLWSYRFDATLCEWQQIDLFGRQHPGHDLGIYPYYPLPGTCLFLAVVSCWGVRWSWWKMALALLAGVGCAAGHVVLFGYDAC